MESKRLVIFGTGDFLSDLFDAALAQGLALSKVVYNVAQVEAPGRILASARIERLRALGIRMQMQPLVEFEPVSGEVYLLGITGPVKQALAEQVKARFALSFCNLIHPTAYVSPLATLGQGVFVGARSVVAAGARLGDHVVVNRAASVGHDSEIGDYSRVQPGATVCGLIRIGRKVTVGAGATVIERLRIGDGAGIAAGAVVVRDVPPNTLVVGVPARIAKPLA